MNTRSNNKQEKGDISPLGWVIIILIVIVALIYFAIGLDKDVEHLKQKLKERKEELERMKGRLAEYTKLRERCVRVKTILRVCLRITIVASLLFLNYEYIKYCFPTSISLKEMLECISTLNSALLFTISIFFFLRYGNFFEMKVTYRSLQIYVIAICIGKKQQTIEAVMRIHIVSIEEINREIIATQEHLIELESTKKEFMKSQDPSETQNTDIV